MRSPISARRQRGFSLLEVMFASTILSVFVLALGGFWRAESSAAIDLTTRQKAIFVLNGEMERISALYVFTNFGNGGPLSTSGYDGISALPASRLTYPSSVGGYTLGNNNEYVTTSANTFYTGSEFQVWLKQASPSTASRAYVWIDRDHGIAGRVSWTTADINVSSCVSGVDCNCLSFSGSGGGKCKTLDLYLEYPYRIGSSGTITAPAALQTLSLKTIVGHG